MKNRIITSFCLLGVAIFVIYYGQLPMFLWSLVVGLLCTYELIQMAKKADTPPFSPLVYILVILGMGSAYLPATKALWHSPIMMTVALALLLFSLYELSQKHIFFSTTRLWITLRIAFFVILTCTYIYLLRDGQAGIVHIVFSLLVIWSTDILALVGGRRFGKTPLSTISPKKTWEGTLIGFFGSVIISWIYIFILSLYFNVHLDMVVYTGLAMLISLVGQAGDLHESLVKRHFRVKDSSTLLPGHGGFYDRADSTMFVTPLVFYLLN